MVWMSLARDMRHNINNSTIQNNVEVPIEVSEGSLDEEMLQLRQERINLGEEQRKLERNARMVKSEMMIAECQEVLILFEREFSAAFDVVLDNNGKDLDTVRPVVDWAKSASVKQFLCISSAGIYKQIDELHLMLKGFREQQPWALTQKRIRGNLKDDVASPGDTIISGIRCMVSMVITEFRNFNGDEMVRAINRHSVTHLPTLPPLLMALISRKALERGARGSTFVDTGEGVNKAALVVDLVMVSTSGDILADPSILITFRVKKLAEEPAEKIGEALVYQKGTEETTEIEKFRADELELAGVKAAQKRELKRNVKHEMAMLSDAKNQALSHADDAIKIEEIHTEKVEFLFAELCHVKALLDSNVKLKSNESTKELNTEVKFLKED
ncbi:hypothetical protein IFM89_007624 [Coptis chinensis]|uniref:Uncharacterized protein n=1 Tax=Coptis chinensis TaxID=261450 RepID=A0A835HUF2_9MAGN|nr:hypothetical protein IFM89_007624 [Coptis chinensis]